MSMYLGALTFVVLLGLVLSRVFLLRTRGIRAMKFGAIDKTDFLIPPFAFLYTGGSTRQFLQSEIIAWLGVLLCLLGLLLVVWTLVSFGQSFRVGIGADHPGNLIEGGVFATSRNPIYVALAIILIGEFLIFSNWITLIYLGAAGVAAAPSGLREEDYLKQHYGPAYDDYCRRVRRYL